MIKLFSFMFFTLLLFSCQDTNTTEGPVNETARDVSVIKELKKDTVANKKVTVEATAKEISWSTKYKGYSYETISNLVYQHKNYAPVLKKYNKITELDKRVLVTDSLMIPSFDDAIKSTALGFYKLLPEEIELIIEARNIYMRYGSDAFSRIPGERSRRAVATDTKLDCLAAAKRMYECVARLEKRTDRPKKAIGQFRQVAEDLSKIANGEIDENGYLLDMVHQRLGLGLKNLIRWQKEISPL